MQWPPTRPGRNGRKFHLVPAASSTSRVSMPRRLNRIARSLTRAMLRSRWVFSITLAASATLMLLALWVPAVITLAYSPSTKSAAAGVEALGAVAAVEIAVERQPAHLLQDRHAHFLGAAGVDRAFVDHRIARPQHLAQGFAGLAQRGQVRAPGAVDRGGHGDDVDVA